MLMDIDDLDKNILKHICSGVHSYEELGDLCKAGRNTIYRRVDNLEKKGIIIRQVRAFPNFEKLNFAAITIGLDIETKDLDKATDFLKTHNQVKFLWKTYGTHDMIFTVVCDKAEVGQAVYTFKKELEKLDIYPTKFDESASITWEKIDFNPF